MHTFSRFVRPYQRSCAAFSAVPVGNQIADYELDDCAVRAAGEVRIAASSVSGRWPGFQVGALFGVVAA
jgi:hypothetical protein